MALIFLEGGEAEEAVGEKGFLLKRLLKWQGIAG
jgi:hypothetical protein